MAKIKKVFEKSKRLKNGNVQHQVLQVIVPATDFDNYEDVEIKLYIDGEFIAEVSNLFDKVGILTDVVDNIDWKKEEVCHV